MSRLAVHYGTDKWGPHQYTPVYHRLFGRRRHQPVRLLEIGVGGYGTRRAGGLSLRMWADYFPHGIIVGLDNMPKCLEMPPRVHVVQGSQDDPVVLERLGEEHGPFDIVIDDGSHVVAHTIASFRALYPRMPPGGIYVVEDVQTAFFPTFGGNLHASGSMLEMAHRVALAIHQLEAAAYHDLPAATEFGTITASVQILRNLVVFERGDNTYPSNHDFARAHPEVEQAYATIDAELARDPAPGPWLARIEMDRVGNRAGDGWAAAQAAVAAWPHDPNVLSQAGLAADRVGALEAAVGLTERLLALEPDNDFLRTLLAERQARWRQESH